MMGTRAIQMAVRMYVYYLAVEIVMYNLANNATMEIIVIMTDVVFLVC
mgnify:CR=1 FL=1